MIIALDDEQNALESLLGAIQKAAGEEAVGFRKTADALAFAREHPCDVAFLDIETRDGSGLDLARELLALNPRMNLIFTTGYSEYGTAALGMHASGYILKPVTPEKIKKELRDLRYPLTEKSVVSRPLYIRAFGNFEIYSFGLPVRFHYTKTKEMLAYLVDRRGALCSNGEIMAALWEDDDESAHTSYLKNLRQDLRSTLKSLGHEDLLISERGGVAVAVRPGLCDYFDYINRFPNALPYRGEYMSQYSWAEMTHAALEMERQKRV